MANLRSLVLTAGGKTQEAQDADTQILSGTVKNNSGSLTVNAAGTSVILQIGGTTKLTLSTTTLTLGSGVSLDSPTLSGTSAGTYTLGGTITIGCTSTAVTVDNSFQWGTASSRFAGVGTRTVNSGVSTLALQSDVVNGATAIGCTIDNTVTFSTTGARILSLQHHETEKAAFHYDGNLIAPGAGTSTSNFHAFPSGTAALVAADDTKLLPAPSSAGRIVYDNGSAWTALAAGTSGYPATSGGAGAPSWSNWIGSNNAAASLSSSPYSITSNDTYEDIGLSCTLGSAGIWLVIAELNGQVQCSSGTGFLTSEFYDATAGAAITSSERIGPYASTTGTLYPATITMAELITVSVSTTLKVYSKRAGGVTYTTSQIVSNTGGRSRIRAVKVSL